MRYIVTLAATMLVVILCAGTVEAQTDDFDPTTAKAIVIDTTKTPSFFSYQPHGPAGARTGGDSCEGDWVGAFVWVKRQNGLVISTSGRADSSGHISVEFRIWGPSTVITQPFTDYLQCYVGVGTAAHDATTYTRASGTNRFGCDLQDSDFGADGRALVFLYGPSHIMDQTGDRAIPPDPATSVTLDMSVSAWDGPLNVGTDENGNATGYVSFTTSTVVQMTMDNICNGIPTVEIDIGGSSTFTTGIQGRRYVDDSRGHCQGNIKYYALSVRDYEFSFTPTHAEEPFRFQLNAYPNCTQTEGCGAANLNMALDMIGPTTIRVPLSVWGGMDYYEIIIRHQNTGYDSVRRDPRTLVAWPRTKTGFSLQMTRIQPPQSRQPYCLPALPTESTGSSEMAGFVGPSQVIEHDPRISSEPIHHLVPLTLVDVSR